MRFCAYLFGFVFSLLLIGLGIVAWTSGPADIQLGMLPWEGPALTRAILILGITGLICVLLAGSSLRGIFPLWCLFVLVTMIRSFFLSSYRFTGAGQFQFAVALTTLALIAFLGSLGVFGRRPARR